MPSTEYNYIICYYMIFYDEDNNAILSWLNWKNFLPKILRSKNFKQKLGKH